MARENRQDGRHPGWVKWWRRKDIARRDWEQARRPFENLPSTLYIKGNVLFQIQASRYIKGDTEFARNAIYIKGDTSLLAERVRYIKGDVLFATFAVYIKGNVNLSNNPPLPDLGQDPAATKPGAISRVWLQLPSVKKDVT